MDVPPEIMTQIFGFMEFFEAVNCLLVSKYFMNIFKNKTWRVEKISIYSHSDYQIITKFKLVIKKLVIDGLLQIENLNLNVLNYQELYLHNINFVNLHDIIKIDPDISDKCKKLVIYKSINFRASLTNSFLCLNECTEIYFQDIEKYDYNDVGTILTNFKNIPKIHKIIISYSSNQNRRYILHNIFDRRFFKYLATNNFDFDFDVTDLFIIKK